MSKSHVKPKVTQSSSKPDGWNVAIEDAQKTIDELKERIGRLKQAISVFAKMREKGEPFPR